MCEGSSNDLIKVMSLYVPARAEENHEEPQDSRHPVRDSNRTSLKDKSQILSPASAWLINTMSHIFSPMVHQTLVDQGLLIIKASRSHSVGLLRASDQMDTATSTWQYTALTTDSHPWPKQDSNAYCQQASSHRPMPYTARPLGSNDTY